MRRPRQPRAPKAPRHETCTVVASVLDRSKVLVQCDGQRVLALGESALIEAEDGTRIRIEVVA